MAMVMKPVAAALALTVGAASFAGTAEAGHRWRHHHHGGDAAAAAIFGLAAGALIGGALATPRYRDYYYYEPAPVYVAPPVYAAPPVYSAPPVVYQGPVYAGGLQPWTAEWYAYCDARYVSFDSSTGYFKGFDGEYHFCR